MAYKRQQGCGFLGWGSCSKYCIAYFAIVVYETETFTEIHDCPFELEECCKGLYLVLGQCFRKGYKNSLLTNSSKVNFLIL